MSFASFGCIFPSHITDVAWWCSRHLQIWNECPTQAGLNSCCCIVGPHMARHRHLVKDPRTWYLCKCPSSIYLKPNETEFSQWLLNKVMKTPCTIKTNLCPWPVTFPVLCVTRASRRPCQPRNFKLALISPSRVVFKQYKSHVKWGIIMQFSSSWDQDGPVIVRFSQP